MLKFKTNPYHLRKLKLLACCSQEANIEMYFVKLMKYLAWNFTEFGVLMT